MGFAITVTITSGCLWLITMQMTNLEPALLSHLPVGGPAQEAVGVAEASPPHEGKGGQTAEAGGNSRHFGYVPKLVPLWIFDTDPNV